MKKNNKQDRESLNSNICQKKKKKIFLLTLDKLVLKK